MARVTKFELTQINTRLASENAELRAALSQAKNDREVLHDLLQAERETHARELEHVEALGLNAVFDVARALGAQIDAAKQQSVQQNAERVVSSRKAAMLAAREEAMRTGRSVLVPNCS